MISETRTIEKDQNYDLLSREPCKACYQMDRLVRELSNLSISHSTLLDLIAASDISFISHTHGRRRRAEISIKKRELQQVLKYGRPVRSTPGKRGDMRWKFIHKNIAYITDYTMKHEITSFRLDDGLIDHNLVQNSGNNVISHTILVVDASSSIKVM